MYAFSWPQSIGDGGTRGLTWVICLGRRGFPNGLFKNYQSGYIYSKQLLLAGRCRVDRLSDEFEKHPIHNLLDQALEKLSSVAANEVKGAISEYIQLKRILSRIQDHLNNIANRDLYPIGELSHLANVLKHNQVTNNLNAFIQQKDASVLAAVNNHILNSLANRAWLYSDSIESTSIDLDVLGLEANVAITAFRNLSKNVTNLETEKNKLEERLEENRKQLDQLTSQWQQQFSEAQDERQKSHNSWSTKVKDEFESTTRDSISNLQKDISETKRNVLSELDSLKESSTNKHNEILSLYQLASGDSIAGGYSQSSRDEEKSANWWRRGTIIFLIATVCWLGYAFKQYGSNEVKVNTLPETATFNWQRYFIGSSITGVLLLSAGFSARQSSKHREEAIRMRRIALQIKALDPYISSLDLDHQKEIKKELIDRFFIGEEQTTGGDGKLDENSMSFIASTIQGVLKTIK
jgi:hypothetical protein